MTGAQADQRSAGVKWAIYGLSFAVCCFAGATQWVSNFELRNNTNHEKTLFMHWWGLCLFLISGSFGMLGVLWASHHFSLRDIRRFSVSWIIQVLESQMFQCFWIKIELGVSKNIGTPKSSILIGFSIINHPFWGTSIFWNRPTLSMFVLPPPLLIDSV